MKIVTTKEVTVEWAKDPQDAVLAVCVRSKQILDEKYTPYALKSAAVTVTYDPTRKLFIALSTDVVEYEKPD